MKIKDLFERKIDRSINGVVKADQLDENSVWQELDEFVVTRELTRHLTDLVAVLLSTIESGEDASGMNGVWISGFFGCGKSHLIKVLAYLLENEEHAHGAEKRHAVDFFADKLDDAMLFGDLKRIVAAPTDTILFNVDSKADHSTGRDALLKVFLKVLNEKQGYSGDHPHIAHMERYLDEHGQLPAFQAAFLREAGESWLSERDAWEFRRDEVISALGEATGQSGASVEKWVDGAEENFSLTVENFAKWVKQYLDRRGEQHRVMFLVDEIGQFIGNDTHLMLNLQTITEQLGTVCQGRAWVVVTSQEDLDSVLGDLRNTKQQDFSKIQGRFKTRLSLSSANVDEVIKKRILDKKEAAQQPLASAYEGKHDILKNQLSFVGAGMTFKSYADVEDFAACYPFAAYQFGLVQKVFESIRKAGATGLHLSQGERSTLDAFQGAAKQVGDDEIGAIVPFYGFYPAVEGFLDTAVKRTIDQAKDNHDLQPFDATILQVLFLIRYIDELPGSVDNLVTLCVDEIDTDRLALRRRIEASLGRLESQTLVGRNGDLYFFLTNEERDIGREIKNIPIASGAEARELGRLLFEDILADHRKHTYELTGKDFSFNRICDGHVVGQKLEGNLEVAFITPLGDDYAEYSEDARCIMDTAATPSRILIRLPDDSTLGRELRTYLQTETYVKTKHTGTLPETTKRILRDRNEENRVRRGRIQVSLKALLAEADYFTSGQPLEIKRSEPKSALADALEYLIKNAYPKMGFIKQLHPNPKQEIQSTLRANDVEKLGLDLKVSDSNVEALAELRDYVDLCARSSKQIVLSDLVDKRYGGVPYGWPELEVVLLVAQLAVLREIDLLVNAAPLALDQAYDHLTSPSKQRRVVLVKRETAGGDLIKKAQALGRELFAETGPGTEGGLFEVLSSHLTSWHSDLSSYAPLVKTGNYPGASEVESGLSILRKFVEETDSVRFLKRFVENKAELTDFAEDIHELQGFYANQRHSWDNLRAAVEELSQNGLQLEGHAEAGPALARMKEILGSPRPYRLLQEVADLTHIARGVNDQLVSEARAPALAAIQGLLGRVQAELDLASAGDTQRATATQRLTKLLATATSATSIAHIAQAEQAADAAYDQALLVIEQAAAPKPGDPEEVTPPAPRVKQRRIVQPKTLLSGGFIETSAEMEEFLTALRAQLEAALESNERIQIK